MRFYCSKEHQQLDWRNHKRHCCCFEIKEDENLGSCMIATRYIEIGTTIAVEYPLAVYNELVTNKGSTWQNLLEDTDSVPQQCPSCEVGQLLPGTLQRCSKCRIPLCGELCERTGLHTVTECKAISEVHKVSPLFVHCMSNKIKVWVAICNVFFLLEGLSLYSYQRYTGGSVPI
jgi:hypothetical protein